MGKVNVKKLLLFSAFAAFAPVAQTYVQCVQGGGVCPFTAQTMLIPAGINLLAVLTALFSNPRH